MGLIQNVKNALLLKRVADRFKEASMQGGLKVTIFGAVTAIVAGVVAKVTETCPTLIPNLWPIVTAGALAGLGLWLRSPKDVTPPKDEPKA